MNAQLKAGECTWHASAGSFGDSWWTLVPLPGTIYYGLSTARVLIHKIPWLVATKAVVGHTWDSWTQLFALWTLNGRSGSHVRFMAASVVPGDTHLSSAGTIVWSLLSFSGRFMKSRYLVHWLISFTNTPSLRDIREIHAFWHIQYKGCFSKFWCATCVICNTTSFKPWTMHILCTWRC